MTHSSPPPRPDRPSPWVVFPRPNPGARLRLFCFPFAGGGASIFAPWARLLPPEVELVAVQLPGRESRLSEPAFSDIDALTPRLGAELAPFMDRPFALFGHSNGGLMAFELARLLRREGRRGLVHLFVSARPAPQLPLTDPPLHALPHDQFLDALRRFNGTPEEVLQNPEIMELIVPMLRADFSLGETYRYTPEAPLAVPLSAYGGVRDLEVPPHQVEPWREQTSAAFQLRMIGGDHFFIVGEREKFLRELNLELRGVLARLVVHA
ncbi:thioesterase II family protein [Longimicrobium sp.]|uniref:thioesterase II family protein n=1 Tax=Longimicrobium sp. TaxID=2029185 RepID=UPI002B6E4038|nr:alpha/beta fold hydrolase [Longimicrobium sp.]HSU14483.1 alpha/beta fold hydrolase [Longimicrobium sp.]